MRAKVISNGTRGGTAVVDANTGKPLPVAIKQCVFDARGDANPRLMLMVECRAEIEADAEFTIFDPSTKKIKKVKQIEFADGSVFEPDAAPQESAQ